MIPNWKVTPTKVDLKAGGEISDSKIGTTPNALRKRQSVRIRTSLGKSCDLPLNTELNAESAGGELAECIWNDPERNENSGEEHGNAREKRSNIRCGLECVRISGYTHDRQTTTDVLTQPTNKNTSPASG